MVTRAAWTLQGYTPVSGVRGTGDGFALYALNGERELEAIGVDATTGEVRWNHPANQSWTVAGVGLFIAAVEGLVVFLAPVGGEGARHGRVTVTGVDARTGEPLWSQPTVDVVTDHPGYCDGGRRICLVGAQGRTRIFAMLDQDGEVESVTPVDDGRMIASNLFPSNDSTELVRIGFDGAEQWRRPARELFAGLPVSPDHGWSIRNQDGRYVGQLGIRFDEAAGGELALDLAGRVTAGFDEAAGEPLWAEVGTHVCAGLGFALDHPVRCRSTGEWVQSADRERDRLEGEVTVEGFDPATGATRWSWPAGQVPGLVFPHESVRRVDDTRYLVTTGSGEVELDVATGQTRPVDGEPVAWCSQRAGYDPAVEVAGRSNNELTVTEWWPCLADGTPVELPTTTPEFAGVRVGGIFAWVGDGTLRAVTVQDPAG